MMRRQEFIAGAGSVAASDRVRGVMRMLKMSSLWSAALIAFLAAGGATSAVSAEDAIPNLASADFGWLL